MAQDDDCEPVLVLSGKKRNGMHLIVVYGVEVWLPLEEFRAIVSMAYAKAIDDEGEGAHISHATIRSLRNRIDAALGQKGVGELLIARR